MSRGAEIEEPGYSVLTQLGDGIEIRHYHDLVQAVVELPDSQHTNQGFRRLAGFIFGANESGQEIAMTAPVQETLFVDQPKMAFTMPSHLKLNDLPRPDDAGITIQPVAARSKAVIQFSGWATAGRVEEMANKLKAVLQDNEVQTRGPAVLAQYNPPWTLPFLRRNEIQLVVDWPGSDRSRKTATAQPVPDQLNRRAGLTNQ